MRTVGFREGIFDNSEGMLNVNLISLLFIIFFWYVQVLLIKCFYGKKMQKGSQTDVFYRVFYVFTKENRPNLRGGIESHR